MIRLLCLTIAFMMCGALQDANAEVRALTVPLTGSASLGKSISTIVNLQLWRTLRKLAADGQPVADARLLWDVGPLEEPTHQAAINRARRLTHTSSIVFWGSVYEQRGDAIVTSFLTLPNFSFFRLDEERHELWRIKARPGTEADVAVDVPSRAYSFKPFLLRSEFLDLYSTPNGLVVRSEPNLTSRILGVLGDQFTRLEGRGDFEKVRFKPGKEGVGWVQLTKMSQNPVEFIDFVSGVIRIYRGDWEHAIEAFSTVASNDSLPIAVQIDALLYTIHAKSMIGSPVDTEVNKVLNLDPYSDVVTKHVFMSILSECERTKRQNAIVEIQSCTPDKIKRAKEGLDRDSYLFTSADPWVAAARELIGSKLN